MQIRDRIRELRRVPARQLRPNPRNWRVHPQRQQDVLRGVLAEIGYADALLARQLADGSLELLDGHLRAQTTPDVEVPVLILDLNDDEAAKLLAVLDPMAGLAETDAGLLGQLVEGLHTDNTAVRGLLDDLAGKPADAPAAGGPAVEPPIPETFQIVVDCENEQQQQTLFERLSGEGFKCRLAML